MCIVTAIVRLTCLALARVSHNLMSQKLVVNRNRGVQDSMNEFAMRMLASWPSHNTDLDNTTLEKVKRPLMPAASRNEEIYVAGFESTKLLTEHPELSLGPTPESLPSDTRRTQLADVVPLTATSSQSKLGCACGVDDQAVMSALGGRSDDGAWSKICSDCAHSTLNIFTGVHQAKFCECLTEQVAISTDCSMCFAEAAQYAFKHCKAECWHDERSKSCRVCVARFDIDDCTGIDVEATLGNKPQAFFEHLPKATVTGMEDQRAVCDFYNYFRNALASSTFAYLWRSMIKVAQALTYQSRPCSVAKLTASNIAALNIAVVIPTK